MHTKYMCMLYFYTINLSEEIYPTMHISNFINPNKSLAYLCSQSSDLIYKFSKSLHCRAF